MTARLVSLTLVIAGIIHVLPLVGVVGSARLAALYGLDFSEPNLAILMRHRAVVIGLLGVFLIYAAFRPSQQPAAFVAGLVSAAAFLGLAWATGGIQLAHGQGRGCRCRRARVPGHRSRLVRADGHGSPVVSEDGRNLDESRGSRIANACLDALFVALIIAVRNRRSLLSRIGPLP